jgi:signal transduction histidine kinase
VPQQVRLDIDALAHELNEPLHALALLHAALRRRVAAVGDPEVDAILADVEAGLLQLQRRMSSLLGFLRLQQLAYTAPPHRVAFPVLPLLQRIALGAERPIRHNRIDLRLVETAAVVESDPALVEAILHNLLLNAVFFAPGGKVLLGCRRAGDHVRVLVGDTGVGIPADEADDISWPLTTRRGAGDELVEGLGLGLAVARRIAERLGHDLELLRSAPGKGSIFALTLPRPGTPPGRERVATAACGGPSRA